MRFDNLSSAALTGSIEGVKDLLAQGADINRKDMFGRTALYWAAREGHIEIVCLLVDQGAALHEKDYRKDTPLSIAKHYGHAEIVKILKEARQRQKQLAKEKARAAADFKKIITAPPASENFTAAIAAGDCAKVRQALDSGFWGNEPLVLRWDHLKIALEHQDKPMLRLLITWGATVPDENVPALTPPQKTLLRQCGLQIPLPQKTENSTLPEKKIGDRMQDGSIYAGLSPELHLPMYVMEKDADMAMNFNKAAATAATLEAHGHNDWHLPTKGELQTLFNNRALIGGFHESSAAGNCWYWSCTVDNMGEVLSQRFNDGLQSSFHKGMHMSARCIRYQKP